MLNDLFVPFNRVIVALLRSPAGSLAGRALMVLEYTGRSSGRRITTPVGYQRASDIYVVLLTKPHSKNWWKNFREPWPAQLSVRRNAMPVIGELLPPDEPAFFDHVETTLRRLPWMGSQVGGIKYNKATGLTDAQRVVVTEHVAVVQFTPSP
ncbi:MAG: nitroreductase/quinone reductase family protein [Microthrixaceae bacterium]